MAGRRLVLLVACLPERSITHAILGRSGADWATEVQGFLIIFYYPESYCEVLKIRPW